MNTLRFHSCAQDPLVGGAYFSAITVPDKPLDQVSLNVIFLLSQFWSQQKQEIVEREVQIFSTFSTQFDGAVKNLAKMAADQTTK